jgi:hypothetical protein
MVVVKKVTVVALQRFPSGDSADFSHNMPMSAPLRPTAYSTQKARYEGFVYFSLDPRLCSTRCRTRRLTAPISCRGGSNSS